jgi:hypothetical protein
MPIILTTGITGLTEFASRLDRLSGKSEERDKLFIEELSRLGGLLVTNLIFETPKATGQLALSTSFRIVHHEVANDETEYRLEIIQTSKSAGFIYRPIVVSGRLPGKIPPALALRGWVQLRWGLNSTQAERGAFRLARSIGSKGTNPNDYTVRAIAMSQGAIQQATNNLGQELITEIMDGF